jgi:hypothetical protein
MLWQKNYTTCNMRALSLSNLMDFSFSRNEISRQLSYFRMIRIFAKIEKRFFVSTGTMPVNEKYQISLT